MVPGPAASTENVAQVLEMQTLRPHPRPSKSESLGVEPRNLSQEDCFLSISIQVCKALLQDTEG